jgi:hypothetical protein
MPDGLLQPTRPPVGGTEVADGDGLPFQPAALAGQGQRPTEMLDGLLIPVVREVGVAKAEVGSGLGLQRPLRHRSGEPGVGDGQVVNGVGA